MPSTTVTELANRLHGTTRKQAIITTALRHLREELNIDTSQADIQFDETPQMNADQSVTFDLVITIGNKLYDVEVYETGHKYEADCWRTNGKLNMMLELDK